MVGVQVTMVECKESYGTLVDGYCSVTEVIIAWGRYLGVPWGVTLVSHCMFYLHPTR